MVFVCVCVVVAVVVAEKYIGTEQCLVCVSLYFTWIMHNGPVANGNDEGVYGRNRVQYPVGFMEDVFLHLPLHACIFYYYHHHHHQNPSASAQKTSDTNEMIIIQTKLNYTRAREKNIAHGVNLQTVIIAIHHHALRHNPGAEPCLYGARHQTPMSQVYPPFGVMVLVALFIRSANIEQRATEHGQKEDGSQPTVDQVQDADLLVELPLLIGLEFFFAE